jgi:FtsP/CotA-like multicopper oxidase with cupredoxin domain
VLTRRAWLGGGLAATLYAPSPAAADAAFELVAAELPGSGAGLGYSGASPGPTLRGTAGKGMKLRFKNALQTPTSLAFPGSGLANSVSGFSGLSGAAVAAGGVQELVITPTDPGFNLYLPYGPPNVAGQLAAGLFGPLVVGELSPPAADLDAVVVFSLLGADLRANVDMAPLTLAGPPGGRARVRLANATPDLVLSLAVSGATAHVIAVDGAPSEIFAPRDGEFPMAPSSRFELMLDLPGPGERVTFAANGGGSALQIETKGDRAPSRSAIAGLPTNPRLPKDIALERAAQVALTLTGSADQGFAINGVHALDWPAKPLFKAARGSPVTLTIVNKTSTPQTMRLEGHVARQLHALDDGWDPYWRDALLIGAGKTVHAAFVADMTGKWPLASASPEKRAKGLLAYYIVT